MLSDLRQALETSRAENTRLQRIIQLKDGQIKLLNFRLFGPKSEKLSSAPMPLLLAEISLTAGEVEREADRPDTQKQNPLPQARQPRPNLPDATSCPNIWNGVKRSFPAIRKTAVAPNAGPSVR